MNFDAYEEQLAEEYYADFMGSPDWELVAQEADAEQIAAILKALHKGLWTEAAVLAYATLRKVAEDHADITAMRETQRLQEDAIIQRQFAHGR